MQQFDGGLGGLLGLFGEDHHQVFQIDPGLGHVGRVERGLGVSHPGHPLACALALQDQLQGGAEVTATLTGQFHQATLDPFFVPLGHVST